MVTKNVMSNHRWVVLETELHSILRDNDVDPGLWLVHDLLVAIREAIDDENLTTYELARRYFKAFPSALVNADAPDWQVARDAVAD